MTTRHLPLAGWAIALAVALPSSARAQSADDEAAREADMFGAPADEDAPPAATAPKPGDPAEATPTPGESPAAEADGADADAAREADMFGGDPLGEDTGQTTTTPSVLPAFTSTLLDDADKFLEIGGQLFLRLNANFKEDQDIGDTPWSAPSLIDIFGDVRPSDRVRGYVRVRLNYDFTVQPGEVNLFGQPLDPFTIQLDQAWVKFDLARIAYITAGRQRIRWGTGRFWNPTDFINQDIRNSVDFFDQRLGVDMLKVHFPLEQLGWNLYLISTFSGIDLIGDTGIGARAEFLFGETEVALSSLVRNDAPLVIGADVSTGLWIFDVRGEGTLQRGLNRPRFKGNLDFDNLEFPEEVDTDDEWFFQGVVGLDLTLRYTDTDSVILGAEYFYNQTGYQDASLYPWLAFNGGFVPLYLGQHYAALFAALPGPFQWDEASFTLSTLSNLSDLSFLTRLDFSLLVLQYITLNVFGAVHYGQVGELRLGIDVPPLPFVPGLENGFILPTDFIDVGVALRVNL